MLIVIDWGTSNLRAFLLDDLGSMVSERANTQGILSVSEKRFTHTLNELIADWLNDYPSAPILLCGMIGSQQGWIETPYLSCPIDLNTLATQLMSVSEGEAYFKRAVKIVPGVQYRNADDIPDVMRGEETQIMGIIDKLPKGNKLEESLICLPGTHSKWAHIKDNKLASFTTLMTGEVFALLTKHSILGQLFKPSTTDFDENAFLQGVQRAEKQGGLLHHIFSTRSRLLFNDMSREYGADYLSGILIGHECADIVKMYPEIKAVTLVCNHALSIRYTKACHHFNLDVTCIDGNKAVVAGLLYLAKAGKMI